MCGTTACLGGCFHYEPHKVLTLWRDTRFTISVAYRQFSGYFSIYFAGFTIFDFKIRALTKEMTI